MALAIRRRKVESGRSRVISIVWSSIFLRPSGMVVVPAAAAPPLTLTHMSGGICLNAETFWADHAAV